MVKKLGRHECDYLYCAWSRDEHYYDEIKNCLNAPSREKKMCV